MATLNDFTLKTNRILNILGLGAVFVVLGFSSCCKPPCNTDQFLKSKPYITGIDKFDSILFDFDTTPSPDIRIKCNQLIVDPNHPDYKNVYVPKLDSLGFKKESTCNCDPKFELWVHPSGNPIDAGTAVGAIIRAGTIGLDSAGIMPNVVIDQKMISNTLLRENSPNAISIPEDCKSAEPYVIAIVDTGVDTITDDNKNKLIAKGWKKYHNSSRCIDNNAAFGLNILHKEKEPLDLLGHGTSVNAVATMASIPNYLDPTLKLRFLNVNIFDPDSNSCTLFDGLCGINYAVNQGAKIVNLSWGFNFNPENDTLGKPLAYNISEVLKAAQNTLFVAGMGNNSNFLLNNHKFYPACLAISVDNLVSVGSINFDRDDLATFSNFSTPDIMTLCTEGEGIIAACLAYDDQTDGSVITQKIVSGTSYAAPLISRVAASIWSRNNTLSPADVKAHFINYLNDTTSTIRGGLKYRSLKVVDIPNLICKSSNK